MTPAMQQADAFAEAVRSLNHATLGPDGYEWPSDVDAVIGCLSSAVVGLGQALFQAGRWLMQAESSGEIGHDQDLDAAAAVLAAAERLSHAVVTSVGLAEDLHGVRELTNHLTGISLAKEDR